MTQEFFIPLVTPSTLNLREHYMVRAKRAKEHRQVATWACRPHPLPCVVTLMREAPRMLDSDNWPGAAKNLRDGIADRLGIKDNDPRVEWRYAQVKAPRSAVGVRVRIEDAE